MTDEPTRPSGPSAKGHAAPATPLVPDKLLALAPSERFHIVVLCGSAGSLDALQRFFQSAPSHTGLAFVVLMHQLPHQDNELVQVLQSFTPMPVREAQDGLRLRPNQVHVNVPDYDLSVLHGTLLLLAPTQLPGRRMPIDFFLESVSKDAQEQIGRAHV